MITSEHDCYPVLTAKQGDNSDLFPDILALYVLEGSHVLDMTYGKGVFWKDIDKSKYTLALNDIKEGLGNMTEDFRCMSFDNEVFDAVILDPPYMHSSKYKSIKKSIDAGYRNNTSDGAGSMESVHSLYTNGIKEARRLLKNKGIFIVKCMDQIESGKQKRAHIWIWQNALDAGFVDEDLFVLVSLAQPALRWKHQLHARKNHSYFLVFRKK